MRRTIMKRVKATAKGGERGRVRTALRGSVLTAHGFGSMLRRFPSTPRERGLFLAECLAARWGWERRGREPRDPIGNTVRVEAQAEVAAEPPEGAGVRIFIRRAVRKGVRE
ncbi:hypothetical protein [Streptomyces sp. NPDC049916]|uniref:hypothetical protein n=1 Tax=Streptomyces sp. NPDC049916 TaxID=3155156 RepID=UPI0034239EFF